MQDVKFSRVSCPSNKRLIRKIGESFGFDLDEMGLTGRVNETQWNAGSSRRSFASFLCARYNGANEVAVYAYLGMLLNRGFCSSEFFMDFLASLYVSHKNEQNLMVAFEGCNRAVLVCLLDGTPALLSPVARRTYNRMRARMRKLMRDGVRPDRINREIESLL